MTQSRQQLVGQITEPGLKPRNINLVVNERPNLTDSESAAGIIWVDNRYEPGDVRRYGSVGDGVADDTVAVQASLNSGHAPFGVFGDTYLISQTSTKTINSIVFYYCLEIPDNTILDLNGSTIQLGDSENAVMLINADAGTTDNSELGVRNGILDGNQANQTNAATGEMSCIFLRDVDRAHVEDLKVVNARQYAGRFLGCTDGYFNNLHCASSDGDGWSFGTTTDDTQVFRCFIDNVYAESCIGDFGTLQGNPWIGVFRDCTVGKMVGVNCAGGSKIQNDSYNSTFAQIVNVGNTNGSGNSGCKIQGSSSNSLWPRGISVGSIVSDNCWGAGLFVNEIHSVSIGEYVGRDNGGGGGTGSQEYDVDIANGTSDGPESLQIGSIYSENNGDTVSIRVGTSVTRFSCDQITLYNSVDVGVQIETAGRVDIGRLQHVDDTGTPVTTFVFKVTGDCEGHLGSLETNLAHSTSQSLVDSSSGLYNFTIGKITLGSTDDLEGVVQLTNASTTTAVTCGHIWRDYQGGTADYLHPIIQVIPWDASAFALSGNFNTVVTDGSSGTGFTINHPSAGASDFVYWKLLGWKVVSQAQA